MTLKQRLERWVADTEEIAKNYDRRREMASNEKDTWEMEHYTNKAEAARQNAQAVRAIIEKGYTVPDLRRNLATLSVQLWNENKTDYHREISQDLAHLIGNSRATR